MVVKRKDSPAEKALLRGLRGTRIHHVAKRARRAAARHVKMPSGIGRISGYPATCRTKTSQLSKLVLAWAMPNQAADEILSGEELGFWRSISAQDWRMAPSNSITTRIGAGSF